MRYGPSCLYNNHSYPAGISVPILLLLFVCLWQFHCIALAAAIQNILYSPGWHQNVLINQPSEYQDYSRAIAPGFLYIILSQDLKTAQAGLKLLSSNNPAPWIVGNSVVSYCVWLIHFKLTYFTFVSVFHMENSSPEHTHETTTSIQKEPAQIINHPTTEPFTMSSGSGMLMPRKNWLLLKMDWCLGISFPVKYKPHSSS